MKRKLPVLIAIILALAVSLAACQLVGQPIATDTLPTFTETTLASDGDLQPAAAEPPKLITEEEAVAIALKAAGFQQTDVTNLHVKLDRDDGIALYEVEFSNAGNEYDYEINAETGAIIESEKDRTDFD